MEAKSNFIDNLRRFYILQTKPTRVGNSLEGFYILFSLYRKYSIVA